MIKVVDWKDPRARKAVINNILGQENVERKERSRAEVDVYRGFLRSYVEYDLRCQFGDIFAKEIPVISSINITKRVVQNDARLYAEGAERTFNGVSEDQEQSLIDIYSDMKIDNVLLKSNRYLELQQQNILHVLPKGGKLILRPYKMHQIDAIPYADNPEKAQSYIVSAFDDSIWQQISNQNKGDGVNQEIADYDDNILKSMVFAVWDVEFQFMMNGKGEIISDIQNVNNKVLGMTSMIDIFHDKDFRFFVKCGNELVDFTIQYNSAASREAQVIKFNGFSQPFLKGPASIFSSKLEIGPSKLLELPTNLDGIGGDTNVEFGYVSPAADLAGVREHRKDLLNDFLRTRGVSTQSFEGGVTHSSGIERLLSMVKDFERSRESQDLYMNVEKQIFDLVVSWRNAAMNTDLLDPKYLKGGAIPRDASVTVEYKKPEMIMTESERLKLANEKIAFGMSSLIKEIMKSKGLNREDAVQYLNEVAEDEREGAPNGVAE